MIVYFFILISISYSQVNSFTFLAETQNKYLSIIDSLALYYPLHVGNVWYYETIRIDNVGIDTFYTKIEINKDTIVNSKSYAIYDIVTLVSGYTRRVLARFDSLTGNYYESYLSFSMEYLKDSTYCTIPGSYYWGYLSLFPDTVFGIVRPCRNAGTQHSHAWGIGYYYSTAYGSGIYVKNRILYAKIDGIEYGLIPVLVDDKENLQPTVLFLSQNYPNPFNPLTKIIYSVPEISNVVIKVFYILGNEIETLVNEERQAGTFEITWYAEDVPSGIYFYQLKTNESTITKKMVVLQ